MISDPSLLQGGAVAANNTPHLISHLQMRTGTQRVTCIHGAPRTPVLGCTEKWSILASPITHI